MNNDHIVGYTQTVYHTCHNWNSGSFWEVEDWDWEEGILYGHDMTEVVFFLFHLYRSILNSMGWTFDFIWPRPEWLSYTHVSIDILAGCSPSDILAAFGGCNKWNWAHIANTQSHCYTTITGILKYSWVGRYFIPLTTCWHLYCCHLSSRWLKVIFLEILLQNSLQLVHSMYYWNSTHIFPYCA